MKILVLPQLSMVTEDGKWAITKDSNWQLTRIWIHYLTSHYKINKIDIILPEENSILGFKEFIDENKISKMNFIHIQHQPLAIYNRYHFNMFELENKLNLPYDLIINDNAEITRNLKVLLLKHKCIDTKIIANIHFPVFRKFNLIPIAVDYYWRQIEAIETADAATLHSYAAFREMLKDKNIMQNKLFICTASFFAKELAKFKSKHKDKTIAYIGRLSDNERTNYKTVLDIIKNLENIKFKVTNPSNCNLGYYNNMITGDFIRREDYYKFIATSSAVLTLHKELGGIGLREAAMLGLSPIVYKTLETTMLCLDKYEFYLTNDLYSNLKKIVDAIDNPISLSSRAKILYSYENNVSQFKLVMESLKL